MRHSQIVFSFYNSTSCRWQHSLHNTPELSFTKLSFWQSNTRSWFGEKSRSGIRTHTKPQTNKPTQEKTLQQNKIFKKSRKCSKYQWEPHWTAMGQVCPVRQSRLKQDFWAVRSIFPLTAQNCSCKLESKGKCVEEPVVAFAVPYWLLGQAGTGRAALWGPGELGASGHGSETSAKTFNPSITHISFCWRGIHLFQQPSPTWPNSLPGSTTPTHEGRLRMLFVNQSINTKGE